MSITLTGHDLTIEDVVRIARFGERVELAEAALAATDRSRDYVDKLVHDNRVVYGVTTGFGSFKNVTIAPSEVEALQKNLIMSHAICTGEPLSEEQVRASILVRLNSLLGGHSGVRPSVVRMLATLLNDKIYPFVPAQGSVGSSGDLAPLSHIILVMLGMGECLVDGKRVPTEKVLRGKGITPIVLQAKEGLALNNGTSVQSGIGCLAVADACMLATLADISLAMSLESLMGSTKAYDARIHALRPHRGQEEVASNIRSLCADSEIIQSHANCNRVQDAYSLRCAPQVHGACRDGIRHVKSVMEVEINSVTDNPLIFAEDDEVMSGGNFHGEPVALVMDYLKTCCSELANISERRTARLVDPALSEGLPAFLTPSEHAGLNSGYMIIQYTAAALVSENKVLAHPASVDSIPTSANQEDHVSMGTIAARQANDIVRNSLSVIAIEMTCAAQALEFRKPLTAGRGTRAAFEAIRNVIPPLTVDRILYTDLERVRTICCDGTIINSARTSVGKLL